jgi:hypothetical protein
MANKGLSAYVMDFGKIVCSELPDKQSDNKNV